MSSLSVNALQHNSASPAVTRGENLLESERLVLVGRCDGTVDLFVDRATGAHCLHTWDTTAFKASTKQASADKLNHSTNAIVGLQWCPQRPSVFITTAKDGTVFCFDLLVDLFAAVATTVLPKQQSSTSAISNGRSSQLLVDMTKQGSRRRGVMFLAGFENKFNMSVVQARQLSSHWTLRRSITSEELLQEEKAVLRELSKFIL